MVQWLGRHSSTAGGVGSTHGQGNTIMHAMRCSQKKEINFKKEKKLLMKKIYSENRNNWGFDSAVAEVQGSMPWGIQEEVRLA